MGELELSTESNYFFFLENISFFMLCPIQTLFRGLAVMFLVTYQPKYTEIFVYVIKYNCLICSKETQIESESEKMSV